MLALLCSASFFCGLTYIQRWPRVQATTLSPYIPSLVPLFPRDVQPPHRIPSSHPCPWPPTPVDLALVLHSLLRLPRVRPNMNAPFPATLGATASSLPPSKPFSLSSHFPPLIRPKVATSSPASFSSGSLSAPLPSPYLPTPSFCATPQFGRKWCSSS